MTVVVERPRFERRAASPARTLGIGVAAPRLSWRSSSPDPSWTQAAYEVEVSRRGLVEVFAVESRESVFEPWPGAPLTSREEAEVRVRVRAGDDSPWSEWSAPARVDAGV
ncbi:hypothetical protein N136_02671, partial [Leifsonia aquatica ATCC 14665]